MKMRKKKHLKRPTLPEAQNYAAWVLDELVLAKTMARLNKYLEATNDEWERWYKENPDAFKGAMCGPTK